MNLEQARELLTRVRIGREPAESCEAINEALRCTGDAPQLTEEFAHEALKAAMYEDSGAGATDHPAKVAARRNQPRFVLSREQCAAVDETAGLENLENHGEHPCEK